MFLLGTGCIVVSWFEHFRTPEWRPYRALMFVGLGVSGVVPILHSLLAYYSFAELNARMGLGWVILQGGLYIFGAFLYAVSKPQVLTRKSAGCARFVLTVVSPNKRFAGLNANTRASSTSGAAPTRSSTSLSSSLPPRTWSAWPRRLTTTIPSSARAAEPWAEPGWYLEP